MKPDPEQQIRNAIADHRQLLDRLEDGDIETLISAARMVTASLRGGGTVYLCGNGGSAADAQHIAGELVGRFRRERKAMAVVALSTDTSVLTAVGNDYAFEDIFARQVEALVREGDLLWAFSTSGSSANVVKAARLARAQGATVLAFTGRDGSELEAIADVCLCAAGPATARSQEMHQVAYHIICDLVEQSIAAGSDDGPSDAR